MTEDDLMAAVAAAPDDDAPRLVLADWLLERGDPRGELIVVQCRRAAGDDDPALAAREAALLEAHAETWLAPLFAIVPEGGFELRRGLVEHAVLWRDDDLDVHGAALAAEAPLLRAVTIRGAALALEPTEAWARLDTARFTEPGYLGADAILRFVRSPHLARLRALEVVNAMLDRDELRALLSLPAPIARAAIHLARVYDTPRVDEAELDALLAARTPPPARTPLSPSRPIFVGEIAVAARLDQKIMAIKQHRLVSNAGLLEAKLAVERAFFGELP